jgi:hypothetical protein
MFMEELNILDFWAKDIGNAYLEALTAEKVYIHILVSCMDYKIVVHSGMTGFLTACLNLDSSHVKQNQTSGCGIQRIHMNKLQYMLMT